MKPVYLKTKFWLSILGLLAGAFALFFPPEQTEQLIDLLGASIIVCVYIIKEIRNDINSLNSPEVRTEWYKRGTLWTAFSAWLVLVLHYFLGDTSSYEQMLGILGIVGTAATYFITDGQLDIKVFQSKEAAKNVIQYLKDKEDKEEKEEKEEKEPYKMEIEIDTKQVEKAIQKGLKNNSDVLKEI